MPRSLNILRKAALLVGVLALATAILLASRSPGTGAYEVSIYTAYPWVFWASVLGGSYVDTESFRIRKPVNVRANPVGYIGHFERHKGVLAFAESIQRTALKVPDAKFLFAGDGKMLAEIREVLAKRCALEEVHFTGWIPNNELPWRLNELKILVLPSTSEGLPGILKEAMACGTIVVSTTVGNVPDLIEDQETGFVCGNSPDEVAAAVVRALSSDDLERISQAARGLVEEQYGLAAAVVSARRGLHKLQRKGESEMIGR